ncbi:helix-turn-helix transcriptional regulator [Actinoplanes sp. NPDC049596]|uniref:PadR family transcriptional regulator n=1 Tax=unclassified Actinoplanes TaxID=2626549 RepID=UPI003443F357
MDIRGHIDLLLLSVLHDRGAVHGYAVITALRDRSKGAFDLPEGTIYPALQRLERAGLVGSRWDDSAPRRRRVYELTEDGRRACADKKTEWRGFVVSVQAVIGPMAVGGPA